MTHIKTILIGLIGVSLGMADISGIVMDTGTTPIAGAVVQLEKGGQTATTGADGSFTLVISTAILTGNSKSLPNGLSASIANNRLTVTVAEHAAIEVATFDLNGKVLSTVRKAIDAGSHSISLPYRGTGIYLYKVKSGIREFVLKGNTVGGTSSGSSVTSQGSSSKPLAKQAKGTAAISDVIASSKTGYLNYRVVTFNSDTTGIQIKMIASAGTVTDADGNVYQTVKIGNQVWTVENLRVTKYNDGSSIPLDTMTTTWVKATTPKYCFYNNTTNSDSINMYGSLYNWYVVNPENTKQIAPTGWHVPSDAEWDTLQNYLIANGNNWDLTLLDNKIAKSLAAKTDWVTYTTTGTIGCEVTKNNVSGFSALPGGCREFSGTFSLQSVSGFWWSATNYDAAGALSRQLHCKNQNILKKIEYKIYGLSIRLVRD